jgi:serine/threonine protein kinase
MLQLTMPSGRRLRFELRAIGAGTFGTVYPGVFEQREVAVKFVRCSLELTSCLRHEIAVISALQHPNIMPLLESMVQVHSALAVSIHVMPRAAYSIQTLLETAAQPMDARRCAAEVFDALAYMHRAGWVHSDVTTMNILVMPDGQHRLADFGVTCRRGTPRAANSVTNESCRAPECFAAHLADFPSDVWSAACVVAEMCCGVPVMFHTCLSGPLAHKLAFADTFRTGCTTLTADPALRALFARCFHHVPAKRATAESIVSLLKTDQVP